VPINNISVPVDAATYYRLEAEKRLLKEGIEPHPAKEEKAKPEKK